MHIAERVPVRKDFPDGVVILDAAWRVVDLNDHARVLLGGDDDPVGRDLRDLLPAALADVFRRHAERAAAD